MPAIVSMLRGVNLGPHRRISMDDLRAVYNSIGLKEPRTYVQSGNVVFETAQRDLPKLAAKIEKAIEQRFGFRSDVILRTAAEMRDVVARNPFAGRRGIEPNKLLVTFLASEPAPDACEKVRSIQADPEELHLLGREIFIYYTNGLARPKVSWTAIADAIKVPGTGRNWNTVVKLLEMAE
jgi:uncharacterized protein (DUF1697 family)